MTKMRRQQLLFINQQGMEKLKPIRDSLPENITYNMIRFVVADRLRTSKIGK